MSLLLTLGLGSSGTPPTPPTGGDTPYMNLLLPTVSVTLGPLYATEVNQAFLRVDAHDHSDGFGHLVGTNGLNINAPLSFHGNDATNLNSAGFNIQSHTAGLTGSIYMSGQDLYAVDGAGNVIQITAAGAVNVSGLGSWTGLTAPAQASYSSVTKKFSLQSNTTGPVYGLLAVGDILLYPGDPNLGTLPYIRLATPNAGVTTYTMQLPPAVPSVIGSQKLMSLNHDGTVTLGPTLPGAKSFMQMDSTGVPYADVVLDGSTLQLTGGSSGTMRVTPGGIGNAQISDLSIAPQKLTRNTATNAASASVVGIGSTTFCSVSLTCSGLRPVQISLRSTTAFAAGFTYNDSVPPNVGYINLRQDGSNVNQARLVSQIASQDVVFPANCVACVLPPPSAGAHTWDLELFVNSATGTLTAGTIILYAQEI